jgi:hypothetical protein
MPIDPATWAFIRDLGFGGLATFALIGGFRSAVRSSGVRLAPVAGTTQAVGLVTTFGRPAVPTLGVSE